MADFMQVEDFKCYQKPRRLRIEVGNLAHNWPPEE